jgi:hypothetical protein
LECVWASKLRQGFSREEGLFEKNKKNCKKSS